MDTLLAYEDLHASVEVITAALHERDAYTRFHCDRVMRLAQALGEACGLSRAELKTLHLGAVFHDIGKIGVPDAVLLKPGRLTAPEWQLMKAHAEQGERIFRSAALECADEVAPIIRHHHESFDGSGYPDGLKGEGIPLLCRILLVVDGYDAMATARSYHRARSHEEVMQIMESEQGTKLDPAVLAEFARLVGQRGQQALL